MYRSLQVADASRHRTERKGTTRGLAARLLEDLSLKMSQTSFTDSIQSIAATISVEQTTLAASLSFQIFIQNK
jgi:hypothetical protein